jgi:hypothetical protein
MTSAVALGALETSVNQDGKRLGGTSTRDPIVTRRYEQLGGVSRGTCLARAGRLEIHGPDDVAHAECAGHVESLGGLDDGGAVELQELYVLA